MNYLNDKKLPVVIVGGAVSTRSLPYVVFSCVEKKIKLKQLKFRTQIGMCSTTLIDRLISGND